jgi:disulfide bond formation protein DsbB
MTNFEKARAFALIIPLGLMAGALGSQILGGLYPCEMCHWQRWPHYAAIALATLAFVVRGGGLGRVLIALAAFAILTSGAIGVFHAGVEYGFWEGLTRCTSTVATVTLDSILNAPMIRCDVPQWTLAGISLAGFNSIISLAGGLAILTLIRREGRI